MNIVISLGSVHGCEIASMQTHSHYYGREIDLFEILVGTYVSESLVYLLYKLKSIAENL